MNKPGKWSRANTYSPARLQAVFDFICDFKAKNNGCAPTLREIVAGAGLSSTSIVKHYLDRLKLRGLIEYGPNEQRLIRVIGSEWRAPAETEIL